MPGLSSSRFSVAGSRLPVAANSRANLGRAFFDCRAGRQRLVVLRHKHSPFRNGLPADGLPLSSEIGRFGRPEAVRQNAPHPLRWRFSRVGADRVPIGRSPGLRPSIRHTTRTVPQLSHEHWYRNREGVRAAVAGDCRPAVEGILRLYSWSPPHGPVALSSTQRS